MFGSLEKNCRNYLSLDAGCRLAGKLNQCLKSRRPSDTQVCNFYAGWLNLIFVIHSSSSMLMRVGKTFPAFRIRTRTHDWTRGGRNLFRIDRPCTFLVDFVVGDTSSKAKNAKQVKLVFAHQPSKPSVRKMCPFVKGRRGKGGRPCFVQITTRATAARSRLLPMHTIIGRGEIEPEENRNNTTGK